MLPKPIKNLANALSTLPEIGPRAALRLVFYLLAQNQKDLDILAESIKNLKSVKTCPQCFNLSDDGLCIFCHDSRRDKKQIMILETILDIIPIERTKIYRGLFHILGGVLSPLEGIGPEKLKINELVSRIKKLQQAEPSVSTPSTLQNHKDLHVDTDGKVPHRVPITHEKNFGTLVREIDKQPIEIIFALNPTTEGDATTLYIERQIKPLSMKITRLGRGLASGSNLEYSDESTIAEALKHRQ